MHDPFYRPDFSFLGRKIAAHAKNTAGQPAGPALSASALIHGFLIAIKTTNRNMGTMVTGRPFRRPTCDRGNAMEKDEWELKWTEFLTVGVPEMDEEHREFLSLANALNQAIIECKDKAAVLRLMDAILVQAAIHFTHEEQLLADCRYPDRAAHAAKHLQVTQQIGRVMKEYAENAIGFVAALKALKIIQLLIDHLLKEDMKYRDFLREQAEPGKVADNIHYLRKRPSLSA
jgi:hemerythrin